eukprot:3469148-Karenia_brevis.AAC.1
MLIDLTNSDVAWSVENPMNSYMWLTPYFIEARSQLMQNQQFNEVSYQACMHGGGRDKKCTLWYSGVDLSSLEKWCDKGHSHLPWGLAHGNSNELFATAEEKRYPVLWCKRVAKLVAEAQGPEFAKSVAGKTATQIQPRRGDNEAVPEYKSIIKVNMGGAQAIKAGDTIPIEGGTGK